MTLMDDFDPEDVDAEDQEQPVESSNRTFLLVAGILGAVLILSLVCIAIYAMVILPRNRDAKSTEVAEINAQNTEVAMLSALTAEARSWTATPTASATPEPSTPTPVLVPTDTPAMVEDAAAVDPRTATVAALLTQQAQKMTLTPASTHLPDTGFMDNVGVPGLVALAVSLVLVIILARRLRMGS